MTATHTGQRTDPDLRNPIWLALGGLVALAAAIGIGRFVYTPILPRMVEGIGMTKTMAGALASVNFAGYLAGALVAASPAVRGSRRGWLMAALAVSAITTAAMGLAESAPVFFLLRFAGGAASAFVLVFASALVLDRLSTIGRSKLSSLHFAGVGTGIAVSAVLVSTLLARGADWRSLWLASGLLSLICLGVVYAWIPAREEERTAFASGPRARSSALRRLVIAYGLFGFGYVITATFLVAIVRASAELRSAEPIVWLVVGLAAVPSVALWSALAHRIGNSMAFAWACALEAVGVAASVLWSAPSGTMLAALLLGGTFMGITALGLIEARRIAPGEPRRTLAMMTASFGLGQILGPAFAGALHDATGSFLLASLAAAVALLAAAALVLTVPRGR